ncbi:hypothetical protein [Streptomyces sp. 8N706]|uniref:hypothetical protein n=1 Tax=Streptomyces sp. 8N706 TaxID=3457416 RepID=UPI003FD181A9
MTTPTAHHNPKPPSSLHTWQQAHDQAVAYALALLATTGTLSRITPPANAPDQRAQWSPHNPTGPTGSIRLFYTPKAEVELTDLHPHDADRVLAGWLTTVASVLHPFPRAEEGPPKLGDQQPDAWYEILPGGAIHPFDPDRHYTSGATARLDEHGHVSVLRIPPSSVPHATVFLALAADPSAPLPTTQPPATPPHSEPGHPPF